MNCDDEQQSRTWRNRSRIMRALHRACDRWLSQAVANTPENRAELRRRVDGVLNRAIRLGWIQKVDPK